MPDWIYKALLGGSAFGVSFGAMIYVLLKHLVEKIIPQSSVFKQQVQQQIANDPTVRAIHNEIKALKQEDTEIKAFYVERLSTQIEKTAAYQQQTSERLAALEAHYKTQSRQLDRIENKVDARNA